MLDCKSRPRFYKMAIRLIRCFGSLHSSVPGSVGRVYFLFYYIFFYFGYCHARHMAVCIHNNYRIAFVHQASRSNLDDPAPSDLGPQLAPGPDLDLASKRV